nr:hypothetical protein Iba_chr07bCG10520 [Ipomoea batatas]GMD20699.1 hypothetical protein Iba_chr07fCG7210 [Ipomoea batatas]
MILALALRSMLLLLLAFLISAMHRLIYPNALISCTWLTIHQMLRYLKISTKLPQLLKLKVAPVEKQEKLMTKVMVARESDGWPWSSLSQL